MTLRNLLPVGATSSGCADSDTHGMALPTEPVLTVTPGQGPPNPLDHRPRCCRTRMGRVRGCIGPARAGALHQRHRIAEAVVERRPAPAQGWQARRMLQRAVLSLASGKRDIDHGPGMTHITMAPRLARARRRLAASPLWWTRLGRRLRRWVPAAIRVPRCRGGQRHGPC
jgi:hypothetical protein